MCCLLMREMWKGKWRGFYVNLKARGERGFAAFLVPIFNVPTFFPVLFLYLVPG